MIYLGLGSNRGNRKRNIAKAIKRLVSEGFELAAISPLVESPALLPDAARPEWNRPYLNCVVCGNTVWSAEQGLAIAKTIESGLGRQPAERWSPRPIDIDLLVWHEEIIRHENLVIPHCGIAHRAFVITPLLHIKPDLTIPGLGKTVFELSQSIKPIPLWMGILNLTADSFSDGGALDSISEVQKRLTEMDHHTVQIIDLGAESTRPNAASVSTEEEWRRLSPVFELIHERFDHHVLKPQISIDSRNWKTLLKAIDSGANIINDVTGLADPNIIDLVKHNGCHAVAMHSVTVPVDPKVKLPTDESAVMQICQWLERKMENWLDAGLDLSKLIVDPGIGFGTNPLQSQQLLGQCQTLRQAGLRLLIGHSRKSFMGSFTDTPSQNRDLETLGISLSLCAQGVDIIRVHDPVSHVRSYRAWSHIEHGRLLKS